MKKLFILSLFFSAMGNAQNLVPDPGFEDTNNVFCGIYSTADFNSTFNYWSAPTSGTPDAFSTQINPSCWNHQPYSTYPGPICLKGSSMPETGNMFAGFFAYTIDGLNQREYIQTPLASATIPGLYYKVEFYLSLADNTEKSTNSIGIYFSTSAVTSGNDQPLFYTPQISTSSFISDTSSWILVSDTFQATAAFNYLTIGNFNDDSNTTTLLNPGGGTGAGCYGVYYFIDDVSVTPLKFSGINDLLSNFHVTVFPNPATNFLTIESDNPFPVEIIIYDLSGRKLFSQKFNEKTILDITPFSPGIYFYSIIQNELQISNGKFIKE